MLTINIKKEQRPCISGGHDRENDSDCNKSHLPVLDHDFIVERLDAVTVKNEAVFLTNAQQTYLL